MTRWRLNGARNLLRNSTTAIRKHWIVGKPWCKECRVADRAVVRAPQIKKVGNQPENLMLWGILLAWYGLQVLTA